PSTRFPLSLHDALPIYPRDVAVVLPGLVGGAEPDVLDLLRRHTRPRHRLANHERGEVVGAHARQRAAIAADRGAHRGQDNGPARSEEHTSELQSLAYLV